MPIPLILGAIAAGGAIGAAIGHKKKKKEQEAFEAECDYKMDKYNAFISDFCKKHSCGSAAIVHYLNKKGRQVVRANDDDDPDHDFFYFTDQDYNNVRNQVYNAASELNNKTGVNDRDLCLWAMDVTMYCIDDDEDTEEEQKALSQAHDYIISHKIINNFNNFNIFAYYQNVCTPETIRQFADELENYSGISKSVILDEKVGYNDAVDFYNNKLKGDEYKEARDRYCCRIILSACDIISDDICAISDANETLLDGEIIDIYNQANGNINRAIEIAKNYQSQAQQEQAAEEHRQWVKSEVDKVEKFVTLGLSGSGKTCFMTGMYHKMTGGVNGYSLKASDEDDVLLSNMCEKLRDKDRQQDRFPASTNQSSRYQFELQHNYKTIEKFEWVDYAGGILKSKTSEDAEAYNALKNDIASSKSMFIFVDGELFADEEIEEADSEREKLQAAVDVITDECARNINHFISEYAGENGKLPPIVIVLTKFDIAMKALSTITNDPEEFVNTVIKKAFNMLFPDTSRFRDEDNSFDSFVSIVPVSLGKHISDDNYSGRLRPIGMEFPAFIGIWFLLDHLREIDTDNSDKYKSAMSMMAEEVEEHNIECCLNGQKGKFGKLAKQYAKNNNR